MRLTVVLSALVLAGVVAVGASIVPAAATPARHSGKVATPTIYPCHPTFC